MAVSNHGDGLDDYSLEGKNEQQRRDTIGKFFMQHWRLGKSATVRHFVRKGMNRQVVYRILGRLEVNGNVHRKRRPLGITSTIPKKVRCKIRKQMKHRIGMSQRKMARKYKISQSSVKNIIKEGDLKFYKRRNIADVSEKQAKKIKTSCSKLRKDFFAPRSGIKMVIDDESYFPFRNNEIPGNAGYYASRTLGPSSAPPNVRFMKEKKFPDKLLCWMVISENGVSKPFFARSKMAMNGEIYRKDCIKGILEPFLMEHHADGKYFFWPDLASAHYAKDTVNLLENLNVRYIPKSCNPPNSPQLRPIETFWARLKDKVYDGGWEAETERQLKQRIRAKVKELKPEESQILFRSVRKRIRKSADGGYLAAI